MTGDRRIPGEARPAAERRWRPTPSLATWSALKPLRISLSPDGEWWIHLGWRPTDDVPAPRTKELVEQLYGIDGVRRVVARVDDILHPHILFWLDGTKPSNEVVPEIANHIQAVFAGEGEITLVQDVDSGQFLSLTLTVQHRPDNLGELVETIGRVSGVHGAVADGDGNTVTALLVPFHGKTEARARQVVADVALAARAFCTVQVVPSWCGFLVVSHTKATLAVARVGFLYPLSSAGWPL